LKSAQVDLLKDDPNVLTYNKLTNVTIEIAEEAGLKDWTVIDNNFGVYVWVKVFLHMGAGVDDSSIVGSSLIDLLYTQDAPAP